MYGVSKLAEMSYTMLLAKEYKDRILVTGCCPGYCATDMSSWRGLPLQIHKSFDIYIYTDTVIFKDELA